MQTTSRGRKGSTTQNLMAVVDFDMKFTYVLARWEGLTHDTLILADALERDDALRVPQGTLQTLLVCHSLRFLV
jgi:hypothetical protein